MNRRNALKGLGMGAFGALGFNASAPDACADQVQNASKGLEPLKITKVRAITTSPMSARLVIIKVETSEPGLYGLAWLKRYFL